MKPFAMIRKTIFMLMPLVWLSLGVFAQKCPVPDLGADIVGDKTACSFIDFTFKIFSYKNNPATTKYEIDFGDGSPVLVLMHNQLSPSNVHSIPHTYTKNTCESPYAKPSSNGTRRYVFKVTASRTDCTGDPAESTVAPVIIVVKPKADFSAPTGCINQPLIFNNLSDGGLTSRCTEDATYLWDFGDPGSANNQQTTQGKSSVNHVYSKTGKYTVRLIAQNATCDPDTTYKEILVCTAPVSQFSINGEKSQDCSNPTTTEICLPGATLALTDASTVDTAECSIAYRWQVNKTTGFVFSNGQTSSTNQHETISFSQVGIYTITQTAYNDCGSSASCFRVTVQDKPTPPDILGLAAWYCSPGTIDVSTSMSGVINNAPITGYTWTFEGTNGTPSPSPPAGSNTSSPATLTGLPAGTYKVTLMVSNVCGSNSASKTFSVYDPPLANAGTDQTVCPGEAANIGGGTIEQGITYTWKRISASGNAVSNSNVLYTQASNTTAGVYEYELTASRGNSCQTSDVVRVKVKDVPPIRLTSTQSIICLSESVTLSATGATNTRWTGGNLNNALGASVIVTPAQTTTYTATGTVPGGCSNVASITIKVNPLPVVTVNAPAGLCIGQTIQASASGAKDYIWQANNGSWQDTGTNVSLSPRQTTSYTVTGTDANNCTNTATFTLTVHPLPVLGLSPDVQICKGQSTSLSASGAYTYTWAPSTGGAALSGNNVTVSPTTTTTYTVEGTSTEGCKNTAQVTVTVQNLPAVAATVNHASICLGESVRLSASGANTYTWAVDNANGGLQASSGAYTTATPTQTTTYTVKGKGGDGCEGTSTVTVVVHPLPLISHNAPTGICQGEKVLITATGAGNGGTYLWKNSAGLSFSGSTFMASPTAATTYTITGTSATGCVDSIFFTLDVYSLPTVSTSANTEICRGQNTTLTSSGAITYTWLPSTGGSSLSGDNITVSPVVTTVYKVVGSNANNCTDTSEVIITVKDLPVVNAGNDFSICVSAAPISLASKTGATPATGGTWVGQGVSNGFFDPTVTGIGTAPIYYSYAAANGCKNTDTLHITINPLPAIDLSGVPAEFCDTNTNIDTDTWTLSPKGGTWSGAGISGKLFNPQAAGIGSHYLRYFFQDNNDCSATDSVLLTIKAPVNIEAGADLSTCQHATLLLTGYSPADLSATAGRWQVLGSNASSTHIVNGNEFKASQPGTYTLQYSYGTGSCEVSDTRQVTVKPLPPATLVTSNATSFCDQDLISVTLKANIGTGLSYEWFRDNIAIAGTGSTLVANQKGSYTVKVTLDGCSTMSAPLEIVRHPLPQPNFAADAIYCVGNLLTFKNITPAMPGYHIGYNWDFGDGTTHITTNGTHTYTDTALVYKVTLTATTSAGCVASVSKNVRIIAPPIVAISKTSIPTNGCSPLQVAFNNQSKGYGLGFSWNFGNGQTSQAASPNVTFSSSKYQDTTYYVSLQITNPCGTKTHRDTIVVKPSPTADFVMEKEVICSNYPLRLFNHSYGKALRYEWDFGDGSPVFSTTDTGFVQHNFIYTGVTDTTYHITLTAFNDCGSHSFSRPLRVIRNVVTAFFQVDKDKGCEPLTVKFTSNQQTQFNTWLVWLWGDGSASNGGLSQTHTYQKAGLYEAKLVVSTGCHVDTFARNIEILSLPMASFTTQATCLNEAARFRNTSPNPFGSTWNFGDGTSYTGTTPPAKYYSQPGTYSVSLTVVHPTNGCTHTINQNIQVHALPQPGFEFPALVCQNTPTPFTNTSVGAVRYAWLLEGNTGLGSSLEHPVHVYQQPGTYTVQLVAFNQQNCSDTLRRQIIVYAKPRAAFNLTSQYSCEYPVTLGLSNASQGANSYDWLINDSLYAQTPDTQVTFTAPGTYTVALVATSPVGCKDTAKFDYEVIEPPVADFITQNREGCQPHMVQFKNTSLHADAWIWNFGDGTSSVLEHPSHVYDTAGVFSVRLAAIHRGNCVDTVTKISWIRVHPKPKAAFRCVPVVHNDGTVGFTNLSEGAVKFFWQLGDGEVSHSHSLFHRYKTNGTFKVTLIVESDKGCLDTLSKKIEINTLYGLFVPNAFAPGKPDAPKDAQVFRAVGVGLREFELVVYDALGNEIWKTNQLNEKGQPVEFWDGTYRGRALPKGAYVWKVTKAVFDNGQVWNGQDLSNPGAKRGLKAGSVTILR